MKKNVSNYLSIFNIFNTWSAFKTNYILKSAKIPFVSLLYMYFEPASSSLFKHMKYPFDTRRLIVKNSNFINFSI